jgi:hypothetical protein
MVAGLPGAQPPPVAGGTAGYGLAPKTEGLTAAVTYLERERAVTLSAARYAGWPVITIERSTYLPLPRSGGTLSRP